MRNEKFKQIKSRNFDFYTHFHALSLAAFFAFTLTSCTPEIIGERPSQKAAKMRIEEGKSIAFNLKFDEGVLTRTSQIHPTWTPATSALVEAYRVVIYQDDRCESSLDQDQTLPPTASSFDFLPPKDGHFTFKILSTLSTGKVLTSECSVPIEVDQTPPLHATSLAFSESSPTRSSTVTANWNPSTSSDIALASLQLYSDSLCLSPSGDPISIGPSDHQKTLPALNQSVMAYRIFLSDAASNQSTSECSSSIQIDQTAPSLASASFNEASPTRLAPLHLSYGTLVDSYSSFCILQNDTDIAHCNFAEGTLPDTYLPLAQGATLLSIYLKDAAGNVSERIDTQEIIYDSIAPSAPTLLSFLQGSTSNSPNVTASWTPSTSSDVVSASLQVFSDGACSIPEGPPIAVNPSDSGRAFTFSPNTTHSYQITVNDAALNQSVSTCSTAILIDLDAPSAAMGLGFIESSPSRATTVTATWTPSISPQLDSVKLQLYSDTACVNSIDSQISLSPTDSSRQFNFNDGETRAFKITVSNASKSADSICSSAITIDQTAPAAPTALTFNEGSLSKNASVTASWTPSVSTDVASMSFQLYSDSACSVPSGTASVVSITATTNSLSVSDGDVRTFKITVGDAAGNSSTSGCSSPITIDRAAPLTPTSLTFTEGSLSKNASVTASWTPSVSTDLASASFQLYADATCSVASGPASALSPSDISKSISVIDGQILSYKISVSDTAGNSSTSVCSSSITIDQTAPSAPTSLSFSEGSLSKNSSVTATWTPSVSTDVTSASFQLYSDGTCSTASGAASALSPSDISKSISVIDGQILSYKISVSDTAGNSSTSGCSSAITIDQTAPAAPTALTFTEGSLSKNSSVTATWTPSVSTDVTSVNFQLYSDAACAVSSGAASTLALSDISKSISVSDGDVRTYKITVADAAGNSSTSGCSSAITIDQTAPARPTTIARKRDNPSYTWGTYTGIQRPILTVSGVSPSDTVSIYKDSSCTSANLIGSATVSAGAFTIDVQPSSNLTDGPYTIYTKAIDLAGNSSNCSSVHEDFTVETTPMSSAIWRAYTQPWGWQANASLGKIWTWSPSPSFRGNQQNKYPNNQVLQRVTLFSDGACGSNGGAIVSTSTPSPVATGYNANGGYINAPGTYSVQIMSYRDNGDSKVNCFGTITQGAPSKLWVNAESVYPAGNQFWFPIQTVDANGSFTNWVAPETVTLKLYTNSSCSVERANYPAGSGFTGPITVTTIGGGAQSPVMSITAPDEYFVKATSSTLSSDCTPFYVLPGEATHLSTSGDGTQIIRGQGNYEPLTLRAYDQFNNRVSGHVRWLPPKSYTEENLEQYGNVFSFSYSSTSFSAGATQVVAQFYSDTAWNNGATSPTLSYTFNLTVTDPNTPTLPTITGRYIGPNPDVIALDQFSWLVHFSGGVSNPNEISGTSFQNECQGQNTPVGSVPSACAEGVAFKATDLGDLDHGTWRLEVTSIAKAGLIAPQLQNAGSILATSLEHYAADPGPFQSAIYNGEPSFDINAHVYACACSPEGVSPISDQFNSVADFRHPIQICSEEELIQFSQFSNDSNYDFHEKTIALCKDLDFSKPNLPTFRPIGMGNPFRGSFYGNGYQIKNLTLNEGYLDQAYDLTQKVQDGSYDLSENNANIGLFSNLEYATLDGVQLVSPRVGGDEKVGALVGVSSHSIIRNVQIKNALIGAGNATGLLIGSSLYDTLLGISASGKVYGIRGDAGGLIGNSRETRLSLSTFHGSVTSGEVAGGLIGRMEGGEISRTAVFGDGVRTLGQLDSRFTPEWSPNPAGGLVGLFQFPSDHLAGDEIITPRIEGAAIHFNTILSTGFNSNPADAGGVIGGFSYHENEHDALALRQIISAPKIVEATGDSNDLRSHPLSPRAAELYGNGRLADFDSQIVVWASSNPKEGEIYGQYSPAWEGEQNLIKAHFSELINFDFLLAYFDQKLWTQQSGTLLPIPLGVTLLDAPTAKVYAHPSPCNCDPKLNLTATGTGDERSPYQVCSVAHLMDISRVESSFFRQCADLDLKDESSFMIPEFRGTFDGNGYVISNLNQTDLGTDQGLFSHTDGATLTRITLFHPTLTGMNGIGALVGRGRNSTIESCHAVGVSLSGGTDSAVGGLIGVGSRGITITNSSASGLISGQTAGGLAGIIANSPIISSINRSAFLSGSIHGVSAAGGLVGTFDHGEGDLSGAGFNVDQAAVYGSEVEAHSTLVGEAASGGFIGATVGSPVSIISSGVYTDTIGSSTSDSYGESYAGGVTGKIDRFVVSHTLGDLIIMPRRVLSHTGSHPIYPDFGNGAAGELMLTGPIGVWLNGGPNQETAPEYLVGTDGSAMLKLNGSFSSFDSTNYDELTNRDFISGLGFHDINDWSAPTSDLAWVVPSNAPTASTVAGIIDLASPIATPTPGSREPASTPTPTPTPVPVCACDANHASRSGTSEAEAIELCSGDEYLQFLLSSQSDNYFQKFINLCVDFDYSRTVFAVGQSKIIGSNETPFKGSFNGNLHSIANLTLNDQELGYNAAGLFRRTDGATLKNIHLASPNFTSNYGPESSASGSIGALVGISRNSTIENCWVNGGSINAGDRENVGGLVGKMESVNTGANRISGSTFQGSVSGQDVGGLVGMITGSASITESGIIDGSITSGFVAGGLIGSAYSDSPKGITISKSLVMADKVFSISSYHYTYSGGLIGSTGGANFIRISDSAIHLDGLVSNSVSQLNSGRAYVGGIIGVYPVYEPQSLEICNIQSSIRYVTVATTNMNPSYPSLAHPIAPEFIQGSINLGTSQSCGNLIAWNAAWLNEPSANYNIYNLSQILNSTDPRFDWTEIWGKQTQVSGSEPLPVPRAFLTYPGRAWGPYTPYPEQ